jgi:hypothetical protein
MSHIAWAYVENVVTVVAACVMAYFLSPWCFLLLFNLNFVQRG